MTDPVQGRPLRVLRKLNVGYRRYSKRMDRLRALRASPPRRRVKKPGNRP